MELKPPVNPGKNATQKALAAYHSQLRRYHRLLEEWDTKLKQKSKLLEAKALVLASLEEEDLPGDLECGCSIDDAMSGCDCEDCEEWRMENPNNPGATGALEKWKAAMGSEETKFFEQYEAQMKSKSHTSDDADPEPEDGGMAIL